MSKKPPLHGIIANISLNDLRRMARELDTPEMRKLFDSEKAEDKAFEQRVKDLAQEVEDLFKHDEDS